MSDQAERPLTAPARQAPRHAAYPPPRRWRRWLLIAALATLLVSGSAAVLLTTLPSTRSDADPAPVLTLTRSEVRIGESYVATASGFAPGEAIRLSWTGPTNGVMDTAPADSTGGRRQGPIIERDPPGSYLIIATGLTSGSTVSTELEVLPADGVPR